LDRDDPFLAVSAGGCDPTCGDRQLGSEERGEFGDEEPVVPVSRHGAFYHVDLVRCRESRFEDFGVRTDAGFRADDQIGDDDFPDPVFHELRLWRGRRCRAGRLGR
jgi:hypothetical protein